MCDAHHICRNVSLRPRALCLSSHVKPQGAPGEVELWPVSSDVGNVRNNRPDLMERATVVAGGGRAGRTAATHSAIAYVLA